METQVPYLIDRLVQAAQSSEQLAGQLVTASVELSTQMTQIEQLLPRPTIGAGQYHAYPVELAPLDQISAAANARGTLVLVMDAVGKWHRCLSASVADDTALLAPITNEAAVRVVPEARKFIYAWACWRVVEAV